MIVGPPYHSLPFADDVDYMDAIIMLNITDHSPWMPGSMQVPPPVGWMALNPTITLDAHPHTATLSPHQAEGFHIMV